MPENAEVIRMIREALTDERTAVVFYSEMMALAPNYDAYQAFYLARRDETQHVVALESLLERLTGRRPEAEVVAPPTFGNFQEGLALAIADEAEAVEMYARVIEMGRTTAVKETFTRIRIDEIMHRAAFEGLIRYNLAGSAVHYLPEPPCIEQPGYLETVSPAPTEKTKDEPEAPPPGKSITWSLPADD